MGLFGGKNSFFNKPLGTGKNSLGAQINNAIGANPKSSSPAPAAAQSPWGEYQPVPTLNENPDTTGAVPSGYPAMPNAYGLGQPQEGAIPGSLSGPEYATKPITVTVPDTSSRGFNPWSLTGESIARDS